MAEKTPEELEQFLLDSLSNPKKFENDMGVLETHSPKDYLAVLRYIDAKKRTRSIQVVPIQFPGTA